jgi:hypothetical protein
MSLASLQIDTAYGRHPLARVVRLERALSRGTFGFEPVRKRVHNTTVRTMIRRARILAAGGEA